MASTPATSFSSDHSHDHSCERRKKQPTEDSALLSPNPTEYSDCYDVKSEAAESAGDESIDGQVIQRAYKVIWNSFCGLPTAHYPTFHFENPASFDILRARLDGQVGLSHFVDNKIRLDWNADTGDLVLRLMPTFVHDNFQDVVKSAIDAELNRVAREHPELEATRRKITPGGHSSACRKHFSKSPDGQFAFKGTQTSPFFLEVAYSEEEKNLLEKTHEYFAKIPGCTLLSFDLDYAVPSKRRRHEHAHDATASLATSMPDTEDSGFVTVDSLVEAEMFRKAGRAVPGDLSIPFKFFVPWEQRGELPDSAATANICLNFTDLARFLSEAEEEQRIRDKTPEPSQPCKGIKWRKKNGEVTTTLAPEPKRPRTRSERPRSRSASPPRRSPRLRSASTHRTRD
ncbi:hypothetical protein GGR56DRAFT_662171 [Xylariaceae sp. FL0804]|nr:hypothetical protein GGR56DRAFT_662171 [Xylariaceae sp. FL0804]